MAAGQNKDGRLAGRKIFITGAAGGIGYATAVLMAEEGAKVALLDVKPRDTWQPPPEGAVFQIDLLDRTVVRAAVVSAAEQLGGLDGVANVAAIGASRPFEEMDDATWDKVVSVNLSAPYAICQAALPYLRQVEGSTIVNVASGAAVRPTGGRGTVYSASKGGLISFTKALAMELAPKIRVNAVMPGIVQTPWTQELILGGHQNPNDAPFVKQYAMKRVAQPRELAYALLYLTSQESSFVTGTTLSVDGGRVFL